MRLRSHQHTNNVPTLLLPCSSCLSNQALLARSLAFFLIRKKTLRNVFCQNGKKQYFFNCLLYEIMIEVVILYTTNLKPWRMNTQAPHPSLSALCCCSFISNQKGNKECFHIVCTARLKIKAFIEGCINQSLLIGIDGFFTSVAKQSYSQLVCGTHDCLPKSSQTMAFLKIHNNNSFSVSLVFFFSLVFSPNK